jgi:hypothetical protein
MFDLVALWEYPVTGDVPAAPQEVRSAIQKIQNPLAAT